MPDKSSTIFSENRSRIVGVVSTPAAWEKALALENGSVDLLEIRLDLLLADESALPGKLADFSTPLLLTVRSPQEGGKGPTEIADRLALYRLHLPDVAVIDLELASAAQGGALIAEAKAAGVAVVLSHHDFDSTPSIEDLETGTQRAADVGADLFKIASTTHSAAELTRLITWLEAPHPLPRAAMGMGRLGKISRPLLAQLGSQLNYGYLDTAIVPGQWPASELQQLLEVL